MGITVYSLLWVMQDLYHQRRCNLLTTITGFPVRTFFPPLRLFSTAKKR